jgi:hypothetical protein
MIDKEVTLIPAAAESIVQRYAATKALSTPLTRR